MCFAIQKTKRMNEIQGIFFFEIALAILKKINEVVYFLSLFPKGFHPEYSGPYTAPNFLTLSR